MKPAADVMAEALKAEGIDLTHIIGPKTPHRYHPDSAREVERRLDSIAACGRNRFPRDVRLVTYTPRYGSCNGVWIDALDRLYDRAVLDVTRGEKEVAVKAGTTAPPVEFSLSAAPPPPKAPEPPPPAPAPPPPPAPVATPNIMPGQPRGLSLLDLAEKSLGGRERKSCDASVSLATSGPP